MKEKKGGELICKRPETIVEARFALTKKQNDIIDMVFATIESDDKLEYEIDLDKYAKLYQLKNKSNVYSDLKKATKSFEGKGFRILNKERKREDYFPWFSRITYLDGESKIVVELGKTLKQLFLDVKRACFYNIEYTLNFKSIYSQRLYYYLKTFEDTGFRVDNLEELKKKLVCPSSYKNFADFKRFVMVPAYEDINGNSDMSFEYKPEYTGRKVTSLKFYIKTNKSRNNKKTNVIEEVCATKEGKYSIEFTNKINEIKKVFEEEITDLGAETIFATAKGDISKIKEKYTLSKNVANIDNIVGWMLNALKKDYKTLKRNGNKEGGFNDYEQREYDFDKLERKLLGWDVKETIETTGEEFQQLAYK